MANLDDRARRAAARLRADAARYVDADAGLERIRHEGGGGKTRSWWSPRLLAAAAAIVVIATGVAVLALRSEPTPVADEPGTTVAPLPTDAPSTVPSTLPATTAPAPTTTEPGPVPTTAPPSPIASALPVVAVAPRLEPLALDGCSLPRCTLASTTVEGSVTLVALDAETETFLVGVDAWQEPVTVTPAEPLGEQAYLVTVGPGMVAYVAAMGELDEAPAMDLVAVALTGEQPGQILERLVGVVDGSGDTDLVPTPDGLVAVGCCGPDTLRPDPAAEPVIRWLGPDGTPLTDPGPHVSVEWVQEGVDGRAYSSLTGGEEWVLLPASTWFRGMPLTAVVGERDYLVAWWEPEVGGRLVRVSGAVGLSYEIAVPAELAIMTMDALGAVVFDGESFQRWTLPTLAASQVVTDTVASWLPADAESATVLIDAALAELRHDDGCEIPPSAEAAVQRTFSDDRVVVFLTQRVGCDDAVGGAVLVLTLARNPETGTWGLERAGSWPLCLRGGTDLCV